MLAQRIPGHFSTEEQVCAFAAKWTISLDLAHKLFELQKRFPFALRIFSGYRTPEQQQGQLDDPTKTAAPVHLSTHTSCPATGADVSVDWDEIAAPIIGGIDIPLPPGMGAGMNDFPTDSMKLYFGRHAEGMGLRWGGGARRENGIPVGNEWHHVDLGRRV